MSLVLRSHPSAKADWKVSGNVSRAGRLIVWSMQVEAPEGYAWHTDQRFGGDLRKNWELWNFDVVEAFLQLRSHAEDVRAPYLEVQLSPLKQGLALVILEPRKAFYTPLSLDFHATSEIKDNKWQSRVELAMPAEFADGELWGGLFSCLGSGERGYYALNPNPEAKPDFHRPELFKKL